jgi:L,D-transpeptidase catalytic domain
MKILKVIWLVTAMMMTSLSLILPAQAGEVTTPQSYSYGDFVVEVQPDGSQVIVGGIYTPTKPAVPLVAAHNILVDFSAKKLEYFRKTTAGIEPVVGYAVVTPEADDLPVAVVSGRVTAIEQNPWWCPTPNGRKKYPFLPPGCLPPGHEYNAMGVAKFIIDWQLPKALKAEWETIRLHGSSGYPLGEFWQYETLGCARLNNEEIVNLIKDLGPDAVREGIAVIFHRGVKPFPAFDATSVAEQKDRFLNGD